MIKKLKQHKLLIIGCLLLVVGMAGYLMRDTLNYVFTPDEVSASSHPDGNSDITPASNNQSGNQTNNNISAGGLPIRIEIPDANINIPVINGYYNQNTQTWTLSKNNAQYAVTTPKPNSSGGNTFIYGHNRSSVFARLPRVKQGSVVSITTDKNQRFTYKMKYTFTTNPADSAFLNYSGAPILTLQTCTGFKYQNRTLFVFELVGVSNV